jgi:hypothetical protein
MALTWIAGIFAAASLPASASAAEVPEAIFHPAVIEATQITPDPGPSGHGPTQGKTFSFSVPASPCDPPTVWHELSVVERPKTKASPHGSTVITAFVEHPAYDTYTGLGAQYEPVCPAYERLFLKRVKLKRPAKDLIFFDGSTSPPSRIWPPVRT